MRTLWHWPEGELIRFDSEEDVKHFFSKMRIEPEEMEMFGIQIKSDQINEWDVEYRVEVYDEALTLPIFDYNPYMSEDRQMASYRRMSVYVEPDNIIVDKEVYSSYPCVAYCFMQSGYDRIGEVDIKVYRVEPLSEIKSPKYYQDKEEQFGEQWKANLDRAVENEEKLEGNG